MNVYVHGTYQSGQWKCHPDRVLVVGGGVGTTGRVGTAVGRGKRVLSVAVTGLAEPVGQVGQLPDQHFRLILLLFILLLPHPQIIIIFIVHIAKMPNINDANMDNANR